MGKASCASLISHGQEQDMLTILTEICPLINLALISDTRENTDESVLVTQLCLTPCDPMNPPGKNTGVGCHALLQGVFPTQESNPGLPHCRWIIYQLSHQGSPRILEWVAYPFSRGSSRPRNQTGVSCTAGGFSTN